MRAFTLALALLAAPCLFATPLQANPEAASELPAFEGHQIRKRLGYGRLTTNDILGDGRDRWRSGSVTTSRVWGYGWSGAAPKRFGELFELRIQGQVISPASLNNPAAGDRPYAGSLSFGLHSHQQFRGWDMALGMDLVFTGAQTGLDGLHKSLHDMIGRPEPTAGVLGAQIGNGVHPTFVGEFGRAFKLNGSTALRPFVEARAGDETLLRAGVDLQFGMVGFGELLVRESITGQRYRAVYRSDPGTSFVLGADMAHVSDSIYLPDGRGYVAEKRRDRLRAGIHWQGKSASAFYGVTYMSKEFSTQPEGQLTGSVRLKLQF